MCEIQEVKWQELKDAYPPFDFSFETTDDLKPFNGLLGQGKAKKELEFALPIEAKGYNIYILGEPGVGKASMAQKCTQQLASKQAVPNDYCYVYDFKSKGGYKSLSLEPGDGKRFQNDMIEFVEYLTNEMPYICATDEYKRAKNNILEEYSKDKALSIMNLEYQMGLESVGYYIKAFKERYKKYNGLIEHLNDLQEDILDKMVIILQEPKLLEEITSKYYVNLLVDNSSLSGAPVIVSPNNPHDKLLGSLSEDYMEVSPGLLHKANGGYLIIEANDIIENFNLWKDIKSTIKSNNIRVKLILLGDLYAYNYLNKEDPNFKSNFKIRVDFENRIKHTRDNVDMLAGLIKTFCDRNMLLPFSAKGVEEIIRQAIRCKGNREYITAQLSRMEDLAIEASTLARLAGDEIVTEKHVQELFLQKRLNYVVASPQVSGERHAQVNALALGSVVKVTASTYKGLPGMVKIEGGSQILPGYLGQIYGQELLISLTARIHIGEDYCKGTHQQTSAAQLYSIISSLSEIPIKQNIAVAGLVNQQGGLEKVNDLARGIESFFAICKQEGLSGNQGVIIAELNKDNLVLSNEIIEAVKNNMFHIYAISNIEDGLEILTGRSYRDIKEKTSEKLKVLSSKN
ncbi:MAG: AAA family ATPase [Epulopiscium sp.]|nr:AAA family ATPase [Candidatus Epulonipiscium sp.]